jgi:hypothetical protein
MFIWRGWGILTAVLLFGGLVLAQVLVNAVAGEGTYEANSAVYGGIGVAVGGIATFLLGQWLDRRNPPRRLVDQETGQQVMVEAKNDLFWIPMKVWGIIGVLGGLIMFLIGAFGIEF